MKNLFLCLLFMLALSACTTKTEQPELPQVAIQSVTFSLDIDPSTLNEKEKGWLEKINAFERSDIYAVKKPYTDRVAHLELWPEDEYCNQAHFDYFDETLALNPTSLIVLTYQALCAKKIEDETILQTSSEAIASISDILMRSGDGSSPETAFRVREVYESQIILQWAGFDVFDAEYVNINGKAFFRIHSINSETAGYSVHYSTNLDYFVTNLQQEMFFNFDKKEMSEVLLNILNNSGDATGSHYFTVNDLVDGKYQDVANSLDGSAELTPLSLVHLGHAFLRLSQDKNFADILVAIEDLSDMGFASASGLLAQQLLAKGLDDNLEVVLEMYRRDIKNIGAEQATLLWLRAFIMDEPKFETFFAFVDNLSHIEMEHWYQAMEIWFDKEDSHSARHLEKLATVYNGLAEAGHSGAQFEMAHLLLNGNWGVSEDIAKGRALLLLSAQSGNHHAQVDYGYYHASGEYGFDRDRNIAIEWYRKSAELGNKYAMFNLGLAYAKGDPMEKDLEAAKSFFQRSLDQGYRPAGCEIGAIYRYKAEQRDVEKALEVYQTTLNGQEFQDNLKECYYGIAVLAQDDFKDVETAVEHYKLAGKAGSSNAYHELGRIYDFGKGLPKDHEKTIKYYELAVDKGHATAAANLGYRYESGEGVQKDLKKALEYYQIAAERKSHQGLNNLATFYLDGTGLEVNVKKAEQLYLEAAELGNDYAANNLGDMYWDGEAGEVNLAKACQYYELAYQRNFLSAYYDIAFCYVRGEGKSRNEAKGFKILIEAVKQDDSQSILELALMYQEGRYVEKNSATALYYLQRYNQPADANGHFYLGDWYRREGQIDLALEHFERSYQMGDDDALVAKIEILYEHELFDKEARRALVDEYSIKTDQNADFVIGCGYYYGDFGEKDFQLARQFFEQAAANQDPGANNNLGEIYRYGQGVEKDVGLAVQYYETAVKLGSPHAAYNLGELFREGEHVSKDDLKAVNFFETAAENGFLPAMKQAAEAYLDDSSDIHDLKKGIFWLQKSAQKGDSESRARLLELTKT